MKKKDLMYFLGNDTPCESIGGTCQQNTLPCPGGYQSGLCGGGVNRMCCKRKFFVFCVYWVFWLLQIMYNP